MVLRISRGTYKVQQDEAETQNVWEDDFWTYLNVNKLEFLKTKVGPFLRQASEVNVVGITFTNNVKWLNDLVLVLDSEMKKRRDRENSFLNLALDIVIDYLSHIDLSEHCKPLYAKADGTMSNAQLINLGVVHEKLEERFLQFSLRTVKCVYKVSVKNLLGLLRYRLESDHLSGHSEETKSLTLMPRDIP